jgi:hypothetical protein
MANLIPTGLHGSIKRDLILDRLANSDGRNEGRGFPTDRQSLHIAKLKRAGWYSYCESPVPERVGTTP